jgi:hypothetical protein
MLVAACDPAPANRPDSRVIVRATPDPEYGKNQTAAQPQPSERTPPPVIAAPAAPSSAALRRHDLRADEARGGHTLERHVGRTDEQLLERLRREPNISAASTYDDQTTAEEVVARAFDQSSAAFDRWSARRGRRPNLVLERREPRPIGRSIRRGQRTSSPCDRALVVLRWDERADSSFVLTSYPDCGR